MELSWAERTSFNGTEITPCCRRPLSWNTWLPSCGEIVRISRLLSQPQGIVRDPRFDWAHDLQLWVELFVIVNLAFLALDIYIAHSVNHFHNSAEYIPFYFSIAAPPAL